MANDVKLEFFADPTGTTQDFTIGANDDPFDTVTIPYDAGVTVKGFIPSLKAPKYVKVRATNLSAAYTVTAFSLFSFVQKG